MEFCFCYYRRILACAKGDRNGYFSVYLELVDPASLSSGWRKEVKFRFTLVNRFGNNRPKYLVCDCFFLIPLVPFWFVKLQKISVFVS